MKRIGEIRRTLFSDETLRVIGFVHTHSSQVHSHHSEKGAIKQCTLVRRKEFLQLSRCRTIQRESPFDPFVYPGNRLRRNIQSVCNSLFVRPLDQVMYLLNSRSICNAERGLDETSLEIREFHGRTFQALIELALEQLVLQSQFRW